MTRFAAVGTKFLACVVALLAALTALCAPVVSAAAEKQQKPKSGGTLTYLAVNEIQSLDPVTYSAGAGDGFWGVRAAAIFDALAVQNATTGAVEMRIAKSITSDDNLHWTIALRPGVKFSDGTAFDAEAVKFNWDRLADINNKPANQTVINQFASVQVSDPLKVAVTLKEANSAFPILVTTISSIGSPTAFKKDPSSFTTAPVGAGPYTVKEWVRNSKLTLERNPTYYGKTYVDELVIAPLADEQQRYNTLISNGGDIDWTQDVATLGTAKQAGLQLVGTSGSLTNAVLFNQSKAPFDDPRARQAIAYAFDAKAMNSALYNGVALTPTSMYPEGSVYYDPALQFPKPNRAKAQKLFDALAADGKAVDFTMTTIPAFANRTAWLQAQLNSFKNVTTRIEQVPLGTPVVLAGNYQMIWLASNFDIPGIYQSLKTGGAGNTIKYSNPQMDAALAEAQAAPTDKDRLAAIAKVQKIYTTDVPTFPYERQQPTMIANKRVHGLTMVGSGGGIDFTTVWLSSS